MKKNLIIAIIIICILVVSLLLYLFMYNTEKNIKDISSFKQVYTSGSDISNLEIKILNVFQKEIGSITDNSDISYVLNEIGDTKIKRNNDLLNGSTYTIKITNKSNNKELLLSISSSQIIIDGNVHKPYKANIDLGNKLSEVIKKYI